MPLSRRTLLGRVIGACGAWAAAAGILPIGGARAARPSGWPADTAWDALRARVGGRLLEGASPLAPCASDAATDACAARLDDLKNPFFIQSQAGGFQTNGWLDGWRAEVSPYAVAAKDTGDIVAAVDFAREHGVKLVIKGAGHDYLGRNCAPDSLLVWTHNMREVSYDPSFRITGAPATAPGVPALTLGAGTRWIEAYQAASAQGRYVQGGGCTTVGAAGGFIQGGGYGSFSKRYGTGAGGVLEYEVVTADGRVLIANQAQNDDLFWALRGGGGGTFGIVTKATLLTHEPPKTLGLLRGKIKASDDAAFRVMLERFVAWYPDALNNPAWGEQIAIRPDNSFEIFMTFLDLGAEQARAVWQPLLDALAAAPGDFSYELGFKINPFSRLWDLDYWLKSDPAFVGVDQRPDAVAGQFWWSVNQGEIAEFINTYQSRWLPLALFQGAEAPGLVEALFAASRHSAVRLQINKGLAGADEQVLARERATSVNPLVLEAATIVIMASRQSPRFPGIAGHAPDLDAGRRAAAPIEAATAILRAATPDGGTYGNEADYFEPDWQRSFYGAHYDRLLAIKRRYDPGNLFKVHHGVGSEF